MASGGFQKKQIDVSKIVQKMIYRLPDMKYFYCKVNYLFIHYKEFIAQWDSYLLTLERNQELLSQKLATYFSEIIHGTFEFFNEIQQQNLYGEGQGEINKKMDETIPTITKIFGYVFMGIYINYPKEILNTFKSMNTEYFDSIRNIIDTYQNSSNLLKIDDKSAINGIEIFVSVVNTSTIQNPVSFAGGFVMFYILALIISSSNYSLNNTQLLIMRANMSSSSTFFQSSAAMPSPSNILLNQCVTELSSQQILINSVTNNSSTTTTKSSNPSTSTPYQTISRLGTSTLSNANNAGTYVG